MFKFTQNMNTSELVYQGELRTEATHIYSGTSIFTDAPLDNQGKAQSFSPTDLVAVALASCIITTIAILMKAENLALEGSRLSVQKIMASDPRRIAEIRIELEVADGKVTDQQKEKLARIAHECPVARSLHPDLKQTVSIRYIGSTDQTI
jgi:putative redox protein